MNMINQKLLTNNSFYFIPLFLPYFVFALEN